MMNKNYENAINKIQASDDFKYKTLKKLETHGCDNHKNISRVFLSMAACILIALGTLLHTNTKSMDLRDRIIVDSQAISASVMVNIEGEIIDVSNDGMSFQLSSGKWVYIDHETQIGMTALNDSEKDQQLFEPSFRIGNTITGFTENKDAKIIYAYAIYTNWNWNEPISIQ
ncbi:hypothetical protein EZV73_26165 [Acidaminobacter sp. JC074]|uniref:hypothetical protein n=1 Tax=Acidaminobacter sp. JC074 TaxID=2530199 RepID=UPI001F0E7514|nr:hypothetical protein [Acidaminobacter sp. JC074]MCH4891090.1 hypothetical protein [Acidaminobacter sp. JC074]